MNKSEQYVNTAEYNVNTAEHNDVSTKYKYITGVHNANTFRQGCQESCLMHVCRYRRQAWSLIQEQQTQIIQDEL